MSSNFSKPNFVFSTPQKSAFQICPFFTETKEVPNSVFKNSLGEISLVLDEKKIYFHLGTKKDYSLTVLQELLAVIVTYPNVECNLKVADFTTKKITENKVLKLLASCFYRCRRKPLSYKTKSKKDNYFPIYVQTTISLPEAKKILAWAKLKITAVNKASDWQDGAPNLLTSESFANLIAQCWKKNSAIKWKILNRQQIEKEKMNLFLSVNAGSLHEPRFVVGEYHGHSKKEIDLVLIGKGIMFDSGGYSLKPSNYQKNMKFDMSGAACVLAAFEAIVATKTSLNVVVLAPLTDNRIGQKATLVESVITAKDGQTVEITNTDAEGRLVLADAIAYSREHYKPKLIVELSTLTGAISVALGDDTSGAFTNKDGFFADFASLANEELEPICFLPVTKASTKRMHSSNVADLLNASSSYQAAASNAAAFLFAFAKETPFLHLDIAGTAHTKSARGLGVMVKTLVEYAQLLAHKK